MTDNLNELTVVKLKELCKKRKLKCHGLRKQEIIDKLRGETEIAKATEASKTEPPNSQLLSDYATRLGYKDSQMAEAVADLKTLGVQPTESNMPVFRRSVHAYIQLLNITKRKPYLAQILERLRALGVDVKDVSEIARGDDTALYKKAERVVHLVRKLRPILTHRDSRGLLETIEELDEEKIPWRDWTELNDRIINTVMFQWAEKQHYIPYRTDYGDFLRKEYRIFINPDKRLSNIEELETVLRDQHIPVRKWWFSLDNHAYAERHELENDMKQAQKSLYGKRVFGDITKYAIPIRKLSNELGLTGDSVEDLWKQLQQLGIRWFTWTGYDDEKMKEFAQWIQATKQQGTPLIPPEIQKLAEDEDIDWKSKTYDELVDLLNLGLKKPRLRGLPAPTAILTTHRSDDAKAALQHLQTMVKNMPLTDLCQGFRKEVREDGFTDAEDFHSNFQTAIRHQQFHPAICMTKRPIGVDIKDAGNGRYIGDDSNVCRESQGPIAALLLIINGDHANAIIINHKRKQIELFEPNGHNWINGKSTLYDYYTFLANTLPSHLNLPDYVVVHPYDSCPLRLKFKFKDSEYDLVEGPQNRVDAGTICEDGGFCVTWSQLYANLRLLAPDATPDETANSLAALKPGQLLSLIRRYLSWKEYLQLHTVSV